MSSSKPEADDSSYPSSPAFTSCGFSTPRQSWELRRIQSESAGQRRSIHSLAGSNSSVCLEQLPLAQVSRHLSRHQGQMELLALPGRRHPHAGRNKRKSGDLSMAAHAELVAAQDRDDAMLGPVDDASLKSNFGGSSKNRRSSSSSSQTHATMQRMTRLDTAAWQIAYDELKFSRLIGEGSFGRVFLGKWRETTVAIKLLTPPAPKAEDSSDNDSDCELSSCSRQTPRCKPGLLDDLDKEAGIMAALRHPNVVMFLGVCLEPPCMVAEVSLLPAAITAALDSCIPHGACAHLCQYSLFQCPASVVCSRSDAAAMVLLSRFSSLICCL